MNKTEHNPNKSKMVSKNEFNCIKRRCNRRRTNFTMEYCDHFRIEESSFYIKALPKFRKLLSRKKSPFDISSRKLCSNLIASFVFVLFFISHAHAQGEIYYYICISIYLYATYQNLYVYVYMYI